jgi:type IV pilus assembly protein PilQ
MTATKMNIQGAGPILRSRIARLLAWVSLLASVSASAENVLQDITFVPGDGGRVDITLQLAEGGVDAQVFTTDQPPRIAVDLADTRNAVSQRRLSIGSGSTSALSAVEAAGRTRVVVDLFRPASYETRMEGNNFVLSISGGAVAASVPSSGMPAMGSADPAKQFAGAVEVSNVDFRRTAEGHGRVVLTFNGEGAAGDMRTDGQRVMVDLPGVAIPTSLVQKLDVIDFATPVHYVEATDTGGGARLTITTGGPFESMAYQAGNEYVVEISAPATAIVDGVAVGAGDEENAVFSGKPVTFNFQDIPVRTVLQLIAEESGLNIVAADTVTGNVTLRLINVPWDQALEIVLRAKALDQRRDGNVVWVAPQTEIAAFEQAKADARIALEQRSEIVTEYIPINYGSAEEIATLLTDDSKSAQGATSSGGGAGGQQQVRGFLSARGSVSFDNRTNTLLISDTVEKIAEVRKLVALLDRPVDQVLIEARIVVASEDFARELGARFGVSGGYEDNNGNILTTSGTLQGTDRMSNVALGNRFGGSSTGLPVSSPGAVGGGILVPALGDRLNVNLPLANPAGSLGFAILGADYLIDLELSALEREGRGEVVASPRVITANQREAVIRQGDEIGYVTIQPAQAGQVPTPNVQFKEVLLELKVVPRITQDGRVYMTMAIKKDDVSGFISTSIGDVPQIDKREISTAVLVDNGQTVVIGGVYEFESREDLNKVPFLGDVPVLGNLFKRKGRSTNKAELLVFVTPKILAVTGRGQ